MASRPFAPIGIEGLVVLIVVAASVASAVGVLMEEGRAQQYVLVSSADWTTAWEPGHASWGPPPSVQQLGGTCLNLSGSYAVGSSVSCRFIEHTWPLVGAVGVAYPFAVLGFSDLVTYGCSGCYEFGVLLSVPQSAGTFNLTGTVYFA